MILAILLAVSCILNAGKGDKVHTQNYACMMDWMIDHVPKRRHSISFNLFDQYRINKVKIDFMPNLTGNPANSLPGLYNLFFMAVDHTDLTVPVQANDVMQYDQIQQ